jgi:hypothetical protein
MKNSILLSIKYVLAFIFAVPGLRDHRSDAAILSQYDLFIEKLITLEGPALSSAIGQTPAWQSFNQWICFHHKQIEALQAEAIDYHKRKKIPLLAANGDSQNSGGYEFELDDFDLNYRLILKEWNYLMKDESEICLFAAHLQTTPEGLSLWVLDRLKTSKGYWIPTEMQNDVSGVEIKDVNWISESLLTIPTEITDEDEEEEDFSEDVCRIDPRLKSAKKYGAYDVKISTAGDQDCQLLDIEKDGISIYHLEDIGTHYNLGVTEQEKFKPFGHFTGTRDPNLVISEWTGGMHCCYSLHIFSLGKNFKKIGTIESGNFYARFKDMDRDGIPEILLYDDFLAYQFSSFAETVTSKVILKFSKDHYRVATEYMRKPRPNIKSLKKSIETWQKMLKKRNFTGDAPEPLIQMVTDLVYTGHKKFAFDIVEKYWPKEAPGKADFFKGYEEALGFSNYYADFEKQL